MTSKIFAPAAGFVLAPRFSCFSELTVLHARSPWGGADCPDNQGNQGNVWSCKRQSGQCPSVPSLLPPSTHRKTGVRRGLSSFREGGALDDEGKSVRTVECSSVGPWPWCERTDCLSSARCRVLRRRFFVECSLSCAALRMRGVGGFLRHSCFLTPSVFQGARSAGSESALRWAAFWVTHSVALP